MTHIDSEVIKNAVQIACRAPSLHNSQPWAWVAEAGVLHLFADQDRIGQATDSSGREVILSCGVVLDHLRVAMAAAGVDTHTERRIASARRRWALVTNGSAVKCSDARWSGSRGLGNRWRRTDRRAFAAPQDWGVV